MKLRTLNDRIMDRVTSFFPSQRAQLPGSQPGKWQPTKVDRNVRKERRRAADKRARLSRKKNRA